MISRHFAQNVTSISTLHEAYECASVDTDILAKFIDTLVTRLCREADVTLLLCLAEKTGWEYMIAAVAKLAKSDDIYTYRRGKQMLDLFDSMPELKTHPDIVKKLQQFDEIFNESVYRLDDYDKHVTSLSKDDATIIFDVYAKKFNVSGQLKKLCAQFGDHKEIENHYNALIENKNLSLFAKFCLLERYFEGYQPFSYADGLISCAQIANRKKHYAFTPTVINCVSQFSTYLQTILRFHQDNPTATIHDRFLYISSHWVCGEIRITPDKKIRLLLSDPVSLDKSNQLSFDTPKLVYALNQAFPGHPVYFPVEKRQYDLESCCIYAVDDLTRLFTVSQYISTQDLFEYFEKQKATPVELSFIRVDSYLSINLERTNITITPVKLPLSFMTTMQSTRLLESKIKHDVIIPSILSTRTPEELATPVNKKGEVIRTSTHGIFKKNIHLDTTENLKLTKKTKRIYLENVLFITRHSLLEINTAMRSVSIDALAAKLTLANQPTEQIHNRVCK